MDISWNRSTRPTKDPSVTVADPMKSEVALRETRSFPRKGGSGPIIALVDLRRAYPKTMSKMIASQDWDCRRDEKLDDSISFWIPHPARNIIGRAIWTVSQGILSPARE
jgi:hypothetical protein